MSNACIVKVQGSDVILYEHWGANPKTMLPFLKEFHTWFTKARGYWDAQYCIAQLVRHTTKKEPELHIPTGFGLYTKDEHNCGHDGHVYELKEDGIYYNGVLFK